MNTTAMSPLVAVLMLGRLGFAPWEYALAFGAPCVVGRSDHGLLAVSSPAFGQQQIMRIAGTLRACWPIALAAIVPGAAGLVLVAAVQFGLLICMGVRLVRSLR